MSVVFIYGLVDPVTNEIRYVGKTSKRLSLRLSNHLSDKLLCHRTNWIRSLVSQGLKPSITLLEEVPAEDWQWYEKWWIIYGKIHHWSLTNGTGGGEGLENPSEETRQKLKLANSGMNNGFYGKIHSEETKKKMSDSLSGTKNPSYGTHPTEETRRKLRAAQTGNRKGAKLEINTVIEIRNRFAKGERQIDLAKEYKVSKSTICEIVNNRTWRNLR